VFVDWFQTRITGQLSLVLAVDLLADTPRVALPGIQIIKVVALCVDGKMNRVGKFAKKPRSHFTFDLRS